jgi:flagellin-like protein
MNKRGVSPIVATVILIVIVVVLAAIIFVWAKGFLTESATKSGRVVESSCEDVDFEVEVVQNAVECSGKSAIDINNIGNIPIYGVKVLQVDDTLGSIEVTDQVFASGTVEAGQSSYACLDTALKDKMAGGTGNLGNLGK